MMPVYLSEDDIQEIKNIVINDKIPYLFIQSVTDYLLLIKISEKLRKRIDCFILDMNKIMDTQSLFIMDPNYNKIYKTYLTHLFIENKIMKKIGEYHKKLMLTGLIN